MNKIAMWWTIGIVVVIIAVIAIVKMHNGNVQNASTNGTQQTPSSLSNASGAADVTPTPTAAAPAPSPTPSNPVSPTAEYSKAVNTYQYRVQISQCHGTVGIAGAGTLNIKKGDKFMLDNHDAATHIMGFGSQRIKVGGYNFAIATATQVGALPLTCDGGGSAQLNVQP